MMLPLFEQIREYRAIMKKNCGGTGKKQKAFDAAMHNMRAIEQRLKAIDKQALALYKPDVRSLMKHNLLPQYHLTSTRACCLCRSKLRL